MSHWLLGELTEVGDRIAHAPRLVVCLDFDGTFATSGAAPEGASLTPATEQALRSLVSCDHVAVAIISSRERADLQQRINLAGLIYAGNHGMEISGPGFVFIEPTAVERTNALKELYTDLSARLQDLPGVAVEDKGLTIGIAYHPTAADQWEELRRRVHEVLAGKSHPFQLSTGERAFEIRPRLYWNKAAAIGWIKEQVGKAGALLLYLGHEAADEEVFAAFPEDLTVKLDGSPETAAHYYLAGPAEVDEFLEWLSLAFSRDALAERGAALR